MKVVQAGFKDLPKIYPLELKCYEFPLEHKQLEESLASPGNIPLIGLIGTLGVGWALGHANQLGELQVVRLAVHHDYRMRGFGRMLVGHLWNEAVKRDCSCIYFMVAEYQLEADDPYSVAAFMDHLQFKAVGIEKGYIGRYGRHYDAIRMERKV